MIRLNGLSRLLELSKAPLHLIEVASTFAKTTPRGSLDFSRGIFLKEHNKSRHNFKTMCALCNFQRAFLFHPEAPRGTPFDRD